MRRGDAHPPPRPLLVIDLAEKKRAHGPAPEAEIKD